MQKIFTNEYFIKKAITKTKMAFVKSKFPMVRNAPEALAELTQYSQAIGFFYFQYGGQNVYALEDKMFWRSKQNVLVLENKMFTHWVLGFGLFSPAPQRVSEMLRKCLVTWHYFLSFLS